MRTVGSFKHKRDAARNWGRLHGFEGRTGGWIYRAGTGIRICQGWDAFAELNMAHANLYQRSDGRWVVKDDADERA